MSNTQDAEAPAPTATVSLNITRGSGVALHASAQVPDEMVIDMAGMIGAMIFDASYADPTSG